MNPEIELTGLSGRNPLGFLAALGALDVTARSGRDATLRWGRGLRPTPFLGGVATADELVALVDRDRARWATSPVLAWPVGDPLADAKPDPEQLAAWAATIADADPVDAGQWCGLVGEGGFDRNGSGKPTHLHFTAGQQKFLVMVRALRDRVDADRIAEALFGPWRYDAALPSLSWEANAERIYAVRATDPSKEKRSSVPGADWLAFLGLRFYPVAVIGGRVRTTACDADWKVSAFRWPLWRGPLGADVVASLVADPTLVAPHVRHDPVVLGQRGVDVVLRAPIRRSDQGGYGSFGAPDVLATAAGS